MRRPGLWAGGALVALALALHAPLLRGEALVSWDVATLRAPWQAAPASVWNPLALDPVLIEWPHADLAHNEGAPRWNPYLLLGERTGQFNWPFPAYPPAALVYRAFPPWLAQGLHSLLHLALAGLAALAWLRWRGHSWRAALAGGIAWELSSWATLWLQASFFHSPLAPWAILAAWSAEAIGRGRSRAPLALAVAVGGATLAGHPQLLVLLLGVLPAITLVTGGGRRVGLTLAGIGLGLCLGAPRLAPLALEYLDGHRASPVDWAAHLAATVELGPRHLLLTVCPDLLGHPVRWFNLLGPSSASYANHQEVRLYLGLPVLLLALVGASAGRVRGYAWILLGAGALAFWPFNGLQSLVPGLSTSSPARVLWLCHLIAPVLVAAGWERLARRDPRALRVALVLLGVTVVVAATVWLEPVASALTPPGRGDPRVVAALLSPASTGLGGGPAPGVARIVGGGRSALMLSPSLGPLLLAAACALLVGLCVRDPSPDRRRLAGAVLAGMLAGELLREGLVYNGSTPPEQLFPETPGLRVAREITGSDGRVVLEPGLQENSLMPLGLRTVGGYGSLHPARLIGLLDALGCRPGRQLVRAHRLPAVWRRALAVRAVIGPPGSQPTEPEGLAQIYDGVDARVWAQADPAPRARVYPWARVLSATGAEALVSSAFDPVAQVAWERETPSSSPSSTPATARVTLDQPERIEVEVAAEQGGLLLLADAYAPGWVASGPNGTELQVVPADHALRGVVLPAGTRGRVTLTYAAPGEVAGWWLGLLALLGLGGLWVRDREADGYEGRRGG